MHTVLRAGFALALAAPLGALADTASDVQALRKEIESIRAEYEARLQALEKRLEAAEAAGAAPAPSPPTPPTLPPVVAGPSGGSATAFNPAVSLILSGLYTRTTQDPDKYAITGVQLPSSVSIGPGTRGFSLSESELGLFANVDPWFRGAANIAVEPDNSVSIEEAYIQTTSLGHGFSLKAGRFFSGIGYLNPQHMHTWDFVDNPLAYQAFLDTQYGDDGVQLTWIAPTEQYIELTTELGRGRSFPGTDTGRNGPGMVAVIAHTGGDVGDSNSWRAGLSMLDAKADDQGLVATNTAGDVVTNSFSGSTRVWVADAIWKWAPHGNAVTTNFKVQGEYLLSRRNGTLVYDVAAVDRPGSYDAVQSGWYLQGVYQPIRYWRVGLRTEQVDPRSPEYGLNSAFFPHIDYRPHKNSLMVDWSPSEFSRVRLQFARDNAHDGFQDSQLFMEYLMSLGAHGAHTF